MKSPTDGGSPIGEKDTMRRCPPARKLPAIGESNDDDRQHRHLHTFAVTRIRDEGTTRKNVTSVTLTAAEKLQVGQAAVRLQRQFAGSLNTEPSIPFSIQCHQFRR